MSVRPQAIQGGRPRDAAGHAGGAARVKLNDVIQKLEGYSNKYGDPEVIIELISFNDYGARRICGSDLGSEFKFSAAHLGTGLPNEPLYLFVTGSSERCPYMP